MVDQLSVTYYGAPAKITIHYKIAADPQDPYNPGTCTFVYLTTC